MQATAQKLSSFLKAWSTLPASEVREYNKSIKSTLGQLSATQKTLQDKGDALHGLGELFDRYHTVSADMKRCVAQADPYKFVLLKALGYNLRNL